MSNKIVCFGEILFDIYPEEKKIGGAPFNVAAHLSQLGNRASIISRIGEDIHGGELLSTVATYKISTETIQMDSRLPTGVVKVLLDDKGSPTYDIANPSSWDNISSSKEDLKLVKEADAFVFGSLACRGARSKSTLLKLADHSNLNICDLNIRQNYYDKNLISKLLELTHVLKLNNQEAKLLQELYKIPKEGFHHELGAKYGISVIIETLGENGAAAYSGGRKVEAPGRKIEVVDTVGSGDAFLASFIHYFLRNGPLEDCLIQACKMGAFVATQKGAIPVYN